MILVVGSTGFLGSIITHRLLAQQMPVRILVRPGSDYHSLAEAGAQPVQGDLKDPASLVSACQSVDVVITTANSAQRGGDDNPFTVEIQGNRNLIDAAKAAGVKQFIFTSISSYEPDSPIPFVAGKGQTEDYLCACGLTYTILAPGPFAEVWLGLMIANPLFQGHPVTVVGGGQGKQAMISTYDVASFAIAAINHPAAFNRRLLLSGPQAYSLCEHVGIFERFLGKPVQINSVNPGEPVPFLPDVAQGLAIATSMQDFAAPMEELARTFNVQLTAPEMVIQRMLNKA
jgi:NADH dehydrogenase